MEEKVHPGDLAARFDFDIEMTWLLYCADAATANSVEDALKF